MLVWQTRGIYIPVVRLSDADTWIVRSNASAQVSLIDTASAKPPLSTLIGAQLIVLERQLNLACKGFGNIQFAVVNNPRRVERKASGALLAVSCNGRIASKCHRSAGIHSVSTRVRIGMVVRALCISVTHLRIVERTCRIFSHRNCARHNHILRIVRRRNPRVR